MVGLPAKLHPTLHLPDFSVVFAFRQYHGCWDSLSINSIPCYVQRTPLPFIHAIILTLLPILVNMKKIQNILFFICENRLPL